MSSNLSGLSAYITAQKKAVSTTDMEEFKDALLSANEALYSIEDPALRKRIKEAGGEFEKLTPGEGGGRRVPLPRNDVPLAWPVILRAAHSGGVCPLRVISRDETGERVSPSK